MAKREVILPAMGEGIIEATITRWLINLGNKVLADEPIVEIATDKVDSEIPSPVDGILQEILYSEGEIPRVGEVIAVIETNEKSAIRKEGIKRQKKQAIKQKETQATEHIQVRKEETRIVDAEQSYFTPLIRQLAKSRGISSAELSNIKGSGKKGQITKDDLNRYIESGRPFKVKEAGYMIDRVVHEKEEQKPYEPAPGEKVVEMDRTRKLIAEHMVYSKHIAPHVTSSVEVDVTELVQWREKNKAEFYKKNGFKLTYTPIIIEAVTSAIKKFKGINIAVYGDSIIEKPDINVGFATALNDGNLIVPVIKNTDRLNLRAIAEQVHSKAARAREGKLKPEEIKNGTFTITNIGQFGNITGTPIINQPQVAILAIGVITKKPWIINIENQQVIAIRDIMVLSMSYDHRVIDGALGGSFLKQISDNLEHYLDNPSKKLDI